MVLVVDRLIVMNEGRVMYDDVPHKVFSNYQELEKMGLRAPQVTYLMNELRGRGFDVMTDVTTVEEAKEELIRVFGRNRGQHA